MTDCVTRQGYISGISIYLLVQNLILETALPLPNANQILMSINQKLHKLGWSDQSSSIIIMLRSSVERMQISSGPNN